METGYMSNQVENFDVFAGIRKPEATQIPLEAYAAPEAAQVALEGNNDACRIITKAVGGEQNIFSLMTYATINETTGEVIIDWEAWERPQIFALATQLDNYRPGAEYNPNEYHIAPQAKIDSAYNEMRAIVGDEEKFQGLVNHLGIVREHTNNMLNIVYQKQAKEMNNAKEIVRAKLPNIMPLIVLMAGSWEAFKVEVNNARIDIQEKLSKSKEYLHATSVAQQDMMKEALRKSAAMLTFGNSVNRNLAQILVPIN